MVRQIVHLLWHAGENWHRPTACGELKDEDCFDADPDRVTCEDCCSMQDAMDLAYSELPKLVRQKRRY